jgi:hypothetical protein
VEGMGNFQSKGDKDSHISIVADALKDLNKGKK